MSGTHTHTFSKEPKVFPGKHATLVLNKTTRVVGMTSGGLLGGWHGIWLGIPGKRQP